VARWSDISQAPEEWTRFYEQYDKPKLAVVGVIDERKNIDLVQRGASEAFPNGSLLILAGHTIPTYRSTVERALESHISGGGQVLWINRRLPEVELDALIGSADMVIAAHSNEGPSGVALKALSAGQRLLLAGADTLRPLAAFGPGVEWTSLRATDLSDAMKRLVAGPRPTPVQFSSPTDFATSLIDPRVE